MKLVVLNILLLIIIGVFSLLFVDSIFSDIGFLNYSSDIIFVQRDLFVYALTFVMVSFSFFEWFSGGVKWYLSYLKSMITISMIYILNGYLFDYMKWDMLCMYNNPRGNTVFFFLVYCSLQFFIWSWLVLFIILIR